MNKLKKVIKIFLSLIFLLIFIQLLIINNLNFKTKIYPIIVYSGSMKPNINVGDLIISKNYDPKKIKVGDIITFRTGVNALITHRVLDVNNVNTLTFKTKGDANNIEDEKKVLKDDVLGRVIFVIPLLGYICVFVKNNLLLFLGVPLFAIGGDLFIKVKHVLKQNN